MPVPADLFSRSDPVEFRKWCRFQLYDMPKSTQEKVIFALRTILGGDLRDRVLRAMRVDLPGVNLPYQEVWSMQRHLNEQPDLLLFRFYTGNPNALLPARVFAMGLTHSAVAHILQGEQQASQSGFAQRAFGQDGRGRPAPPGRLGSSSYRTTPTQLREGLAVQAADLQNMVGRDERDHTVLQTILLQGWTPERMAECWMAFKHQTGRRDNSPFLSCTAVMPRMVRSGSAVLQQDVIPKAPYLGLFLVPNDNFLVEWVHSTATRLDSVIHSVQEVEVVYKPPPKMEDCQLLRFSNPFCRENGGNRPCGQPDDTRINKLSQTRDPGFAPDDMPGLVYSPDANLLALD